MQEDSAKAPLIVHLDRETMGGFDIPRPDAPHRWQEYDFSQPDEVVARLQGAQVAIINKVKLDAATLAQLPDLKLVAVTATGTDVVDSKAAAGLGISVRNVVGYAGTSVAEHVIMLLFALVRGLVPHRDSVIDGRWENGRTFCVFASPVRDVAEMRLGLVGSGAISRAVASRARALGMDVVFAGRPGAGPSEGKLAFEEVLATSDVLSLHCPLTDETRNLLNAQTLATMKPGAIIINTARGALIDYDALESALESGQTGGAGLDVAPVEPPPPGSPILRLARRSDVIVTPHAAWSSAQAIGTLAQATSQNVADFLAGR
ncbi:MAG: glycerate dehydrogenase [Sphingobium sp.]|nr:glycerate dehydrogenase [Sphingobium sp.]